MAVEFISGKDHYDKVVARMASVRKSLWIGTADIKGLHVKAGNSSEPFLAILAKLLKRGVEVRLIHAKEPGPIPDSKIRTGADTMSASPFQDDYI